MRAAILHSHFSIHLNVVAPKHDLRMVKEAEFNLVAMCKEVI